MKYISVVILSTLLFISGCATHDEPSISSDITTFGGVPCHKIYVKPQVNNRIGKAGGEIVITLYYPEGNSNTLTNEFFEQSLNLDAPFVKIKGRTQVNERTVDYTFSFEENNSGSERMVAARVADTSYRSKDIHAAVGYFDITQEAK